MGKENPSARTPKSQPLPEQAYSERTINAVVKLVKRTGELNDARIRAENIIEAALDAIITVDHDFYVVQFNRAAEKMFGYTQEQVTGTSFFQLLPRHNCRNPFLNSFEAIEAVGTTTEQGSHLTLTGLRADGSEFPFEGSISSAVVNKKTFYSIIIRDISERLKAEKLEKELNLQLLHQNERLQQFEFMASHNLRGPVATILGLTQLLQLNTSPNLVQQEQVVSYLQQSALKLDNIIRDLQQILDHQHRADLVKEELAVCDIVTQVCQDLKEAITSTNTTINSDYSRASMLYGTRTSLSNIFYQLISNAIKFRNPAIKPEIRIETYERDGYIYATITDNGLGLDINRYAHKLFSPYSRFHTHVEGKGLGLHVVRTLLRQMGGDIRIDSKLRAGTSCTIFIPLHQ
ncbi:PAS domain S-box protein [Cesiribacter sp. SM1]|uniref:sensor histidine kinase n=1 Tax=Cesiribacter sp. SM1 TaxID=2861196 RepID=UPI001CD6F2F7|nr:PAS domain-containing sensor histidine kinase [Cesiribacter sp. SM1]